MKILLYSTKMAAAIICFSSMSFAQIQTVDDLSKQILPPSPHAASLGKYGDLPVNYHTGGVTVGIPLYEVKIGSLSLPLSLSYQTSGIRVTDVASRVGLGWTLQGEGVITRTVRGLPDEQSLGYNYTNGIVKYTDLTNTLTNQQYWAAEMVAMGQLDSEPDVYFFNFMGHSGKFYVDPTAGIVQLPHSNLVISPQWTITGEDGTQYFFNTAAEGTQTVSSGGAPVSYTSSWYLTRILTPKNEEILFTYENNPTVIQYGWILSETDYYSSDGGSKAPVRTISQQQIGGIRLKTIETRIEKLDFTYDQSENGGNGRLDLKGDYRLKKISVSSKITNQCFKEFDLNHHYSNATASCNIPNFPSFPYVANDNYRLKLDEVVERSCDSEQTRKHSFEYNPTLLPSRCSFDQDHWGYYNAKGNTTLKPRISFVPPSYPIGDRSANPLTLGAESLTEIHYPTGGYTQFEFEPHKLNGPTTYDALQQTSASITNAQIGVYNQQSFVVNSDQLAQIDINYNFQVYDGTGATVQLFKNGTLVYTASLDAVNQVNDGGHFISPPIQLYADTYALRVANTSDVNGTSINASISYYNSVTQTMDSYFGGQRIKSISDYTDADVLATKKTFTYENTAILNPVSTVNYYYMMSETVFSGACYDLGGGPGPVTYDYVVRTSNNNFSLGTSQGSHVAYGKVTVQNEGINNGKSVYEYTTDADLDAGAYFPFPPATSLEHRRGLLTREAHYDDQDVLVKETLNTYQFDAVATIGAFKTGFEHNSLCYDSNNDGRNQDHLVYGIYRMISEWVKLTSTEERDYPGPVVSHTNKYYDNIQHMQLTRNEKLRSDGKYDLEYFVFPKDYASGTDFIDLLTTGKIKNAMVEHVTAIGDANGSNKQITGGKINKYSTTQAGFIKEIQMLELSDPLPLTSFNFSNRTTGVLPTDGTATSFSANSNYTSNVFFDSFDTYGNTTQFHTNQGFNVSVKWGYNSSHPIAFVKNAEATEVFYEGFEEDASAVAAGQAYLGGSKYKTGSFTAVFTRPNGKSYTLSYWTLVSGNWQHVTAPLTTDNPVINPGVPFDEVFIYPTTSDFKLFNFDLTTFNVINETNPTHTLNYYSYDKLLRLSTIRDYNKDIVSQFLYHYKTSGQ
ncbi:MAG TPA: hypothetical protein VL728_12755 [Cyclobacteriaceae bacterium]|jgi:hypothetical protein|nr:hypothetical protein [Cyclobacteriaceae bacterium]